MLFAADLMLLGWGLNSYKISYKCLTVSKKMLAGNIFIKAGKFGSVIIKGKPQEDKCCFLPKVILIRYEEGENENKKVKYL